MMLEPLPRVLIWLLFTVRYIDDLFLPVFGDAAQVVGQSWFYDRREDGGDDETSAPGARELALQIARRCTMRTHARRSR